MDRTQEARLTTALRIARLGTFEWDVCNCVIALDERGCELFGLDPGRTFTATDIVARVHPDDLDRIKIEVQRSLEELSRLETEYRVILPNGTTRIVASTSEILAASDRTAEIVAGVVREVTDKYSRKSEFEGRALRPDMALDIAGLGEWEFDLSREVFTRTIGHDRIFGYAESLPSWSLEQFLGHVIEEDRDRVKEVALRSVHTGEPPEFECRITRISGERRWISIRSQVDRNRDGHPVAFRGIVQDVTDTREAEARFRALVETAPALIFATDASGRNTFVNQRYQDYTGLSFDQLCGDGWQSIIHPEDRPAMLAAELGGAAEGSYLEQRMRIRRQDGAWRWFLSRTEPVRGAAEPSSFAWLGISIDIDDQVHAEERERLLAHEVDHRAKNMLTVVQSILHLTDAPDVPSFKAAAEERVHALGRAHSLLVQSRWTGVEFRTLVSEELAAFSRLGQTSASGPKTSIFLKPEAAQSIALVLHELVTNAAKYGALSTSNGSVEVGWSLIAVGSEEYLEVLWTESGGPPARPPHRQGFGSTVIRSSIERQLRGTIQLDWRHEGLICSFRVPARLALTLP